MEAHRWSQMVRPEAPKGLKKKKGKKKGKEREGGKQRDRKRKRGQRWEGYQETQERRKGK